MATRASDPLLLGAPPPAAPREDLLTGERGMMAVINVVAVLFCSILVGLVTNVAAVSNRKVELQNTADAATLSGAVWQARGLNAITATNHVMGEMLAFVIIHEGLGGEYLDEFAETGRKDDDKEQAPDDANFNLTLWREVARVAGLLYGGDIDTSVYDRVKEEDGVHAEATLRDAKVDLKRWLCLCYKLRAIGSVIAPLPIIGPIGQAIVAAMQGLEQVLGLEYLFLNGVDQLAVGLVPAKKALRDVLLPAAKGYTDFVVQTVPGVAENSAAEIARLAGGEGLLLPVNNVSDATDPVDNVLAGLSGPGPSLPVRIDPIARFLEPVSDDVDDGDLFGGLLDDFGVGGLLGGSGGQDAFDGSSGGLLDLFGGGGSTDPDGRPSDEVVRATQLARATWPWVSYHRHPLYAALKTFTPFSGAEAYYLRYTSLFGNRILVRAQTERDPAKNLALYVLKNDEQDTPLMTRGFETWVQADPRRADDLFTVIGLARRGPPPLVSGPAIYRNAHPDGMLGFAQAIAYNANEQDVPDQPVRIREGGVTPTRQARVGWDTLNWDEDFAPPEEMIDRWPGVDTFPGGFLVGPITIPKNPFDSSEDPPHDLPRVKVNWQAQLVPVTQNRLADAQLELELRANLLPDRAKVERIRTLARRLPLALLPESLITR